MVARRTGILVSRLMALGALFTASGCHGYYSSYRYSPNRQVHELQLEEEGRPVARVSASLVGVLRPGDLDHRRLHALLEVENPGNDQVQIPVQQIEAVPSGVRKLQPSNELQEVVLQPGEERSIDVFFPLPTGSQLPASAMSEIDLSWVVNVAGVSRRSHATFERRSSGYNRWGSNDPYFWGPGPFFGYRRFNYYPGFYWRRCY